MSREYGGTKAAYAVDDSGKRTLDEVIDGGYFPRLFQARGADSGDGEENGPRANDSGAG